MDDEEWDEHPHEQTLQAAVRHLLTTDDLDEIRAAAGVAALIDDTGQPVTVTAARTYRDAGVLTLDRGVWLELSGGGRFALSIGVSARPVGEVTLRRPDPPRRPGHPPPTRSRRVDGGNLARRPPQIRT